MKTIGPLYSGKLNVRWDGKGMVKSHPSTLGLSGFPVAIQSAFPKTEVQLFIVHQICQSIHYVATKDQKPFLKNLKSIYGADTKEQAEQNLLELDEKGGKQYPVDI